MEVPCKEEKNTLQVVHLDSAISLTYQVFGKPIGVAPVVVVNHALTGNSNVAGAKGWWNSLIGDKAVIDTETYTVLCFNVPGNGFGMPSWTIDNYDIEFTTKTIATLFWEAIQKLGIKHLHAVIGGSLGGAIAWEMGFIQPFSIDYVVPIATHYKANDWLLANVLVQEQILNNSNKPIHDARMHAMLLYRTPQSLQAKFHLQKTGEQYQVTSWLSYHGETLENRFSLEAYKAMNHLLKTIGQDRTEKDLIDYAKKTTATIHQIAVSTDYFFIAEDVRFTHQNILQVNSKAVYSEIDSIHGHDAFLIELEQLHTILQPIFTKHTN